MEELEPGQDRTRRRFESAIAVAAPFLDLVRAAGERISRIVEPTDYEYYPVRADEGEEDAAPDPGPGR